jgi:hypothetical protein
VRFAIFVIAVALAAGAALGMSTNASLRSQAIASAGIDPAKFSVADLNPIRAAYDYVAAEIAKPKTPESLGFAPSQPIGPFVDLAGVGAGFKLDTNWQKMWGASIAQQNQRFNNRMEDVRNYARNPTGWRGAPP